MAKRMARIPAAIPLRWLGFSLACHALVGLALQGPPSHGEALHPLEGDPNTPSDEASIAVDEPSETAAPSEQAPTALAPSPLGMPTTTARRRDSPTSVRSTPPAAPLMGATEDRSASYLPFAFTRQLGDTASRYTDLLWNHTPPGTRATAKVDLDLTDEGTLTAIGIEANHEALEQALRPTLSLLTHRRFTARGHHVSFQVEMRVSSDAVHDEFRGNVFALGQTYDADARRGHSFFSLAIGRRVDFEIKVVER